MLFPTWPKRPLETDTRDFLFLPIYGMTLFSNKGLAPVMSQSGNLGKKGTVWGDYFGVMIQSSPIFHFTYV